MKVGEENVRVPVKVTGKIVERLDIEDLKEFVINSIKNADEQFELTENEKSKVLSALAERPNLFKETNLLFLEQFESSFLKDTKEKCYLFFEHSLCEITKSNIHFIKNDDAPGYILKDDIRPNWKELDIDENNRPLIVIDEQIQLVKEEDREFEKFFKLICSDKSENKAAGKFESLQSIIGYLVSTYKDPSLTKTVILMDENYTDLPMGRTGKTLILEALKDNTTQI